MIKSLIRKIEPKKIKLNCSFGESITRAMIPVIPSAKTEKHARKVASYIDGFLKEKGYSTHECCATISGKSIVLTWFPGVQNSKHIKISIFENEVSFKIVEGIKSSDWIKAFSYIRLNPSLLWIFDDSFLREVG